VDHLFFFLSDSLCGQIG